MEIYERIKLVALHNGLKKNRELIEVVMQQKPILQRTGNPPSEKSLYAYLNGSRNMDSGLLVAFTKALKVPESVLMQGFLNGIEVFFYNTDTGEYEYNPSKEAKEHYESKSINNSNTMGIEIRKYDGAIGAGSFGIMDETLISTTFLPNGIFNGNTPKNTKHLMAFEVAGDSMSPIIEERNWVIIDMVDGREYNPVDGIYLCNIDSSYQIKRLQFMGTRGVKIISENQNYETLDSNDCSVFEVIGKLFTIIKIGSGLALK